MRRTAAGSGYGRRRRVGEMNAARCGSNSIWLLLLLCGGFCRRSDCVWINLKWVYTHLVIACMCVCVFDVALKWLILICEFRLFRIGFSTIQAEIVYKISTYINTRIYLHTA